MHCKSLWIKASAKCININVNIATSIESHLLMKGLTTLVISKGTNLNVKAYSEILGNCVLPIL